VRSKHGELAPFSTPPAMQLLEPARVRDAVFHMYGYNPSNRHDTEVRLKALENYFRPLYVSETTWLYEIVGFHARGWGLGAGGPGYFFIVNVISTVTMTGTG
jgi:hypothetical protein